MKRWLALALLVSTVALATPVPILEFKDTVNPGSGEYLISQIERADKDQAPYLIIVMDTPGGLLTTTRLVVQKMLSSTTPIVVFVGPKGAHAGSAGALITLAADVAAMAPATNIGAAHPVVPGEKMDKTMAAKMANDTSAFAESIAKTRGRNHDWAIKAVKDSASITSDEALNKGIIDLIADDLEDLKNKLPSTRLKAPKGAITQLPAEKQEYAGVQPSLRNRIVSFFADPNLAYLIMSLGALCIWIELSHPGLIFPGVLGAVCIVISMVSFQMMPISYGALALILLGLAFVVAELFLPTYGILGIVGITAFIFGSLFLMDTHSPEFQISLKLILPTAAALAGSAIAIGYAVVKAQNKKHLSGLEALIGELGETRELTTDKAGKVFIHGELWNAVTEGQAEIPKGTVVVVRQVRQLELVVAERT